MAVVSIGTLTDLEKVDYVREGLEIAKPELIYAQYGQGDRVAKRDGKTRQWFRMTKIGILGNSTSWGGSITYIKNATGAPPTFTPATPADTTVTATADYLFGQGHEWNDAVEYTSFADLPKELRVINAQHAAEAIDTEVRDVVVGGSNVYYANNKASRGLLTSADQIDMNDIFDAVTVERNYDSKPVKGMYPALCSANVVAQLMKDTAFQTAVAQQKDYIFTCTIAELYGVRFHFTSMAPTVSNSGSNNAVSKVEQTMIIGANAFGVTKWMLNDYDLVYTAPGGWGDEWAVRHALTWKYAMKAVRLNETFMLRLESAR